MKNIKFILLVVLVLFIYSCKIDNEPNSKKAISDLVLRFPQLIEGKNIKERRFKHIRTVIDGETNIKILLYSQSKQVNNNNQIIVIINEVNKCVALPLFNNKHRDYWNFANDKLIHNVKRINTTFEKEYDSALNLLQKGSVLNKEIVSGNITKELFYSILHLQPIDTLNGDLELCKMKYAVSDIPIENEDSVRIRFEKNYEDIKNDLKNFSASYSYLYDSNSHRIYRISYDYKEQKFRFKVYRQDFGIKPITPVYL